MDYIKQLKGFRIARVTNPIGKNAKLLYFILLDEANAAFFPEWLCLSNSTLQGCSDLNKTDIFRARNELVQKGYIEYQKGVKGQSPRYKIISFENSVSSSVADTETDNATDLQPICNQYCNQSVTNTATNTETIYKQNNTKQDNINNNNIRAYRVYDEKSGFRTSTTAWEGITDYLNSGMSDDVICAVIEDAAETAERFSWRYVDSVLRDKQKKGIFTLSAYKRDKAEWERSRKRDSSPPANEPQYKPIVLELAKYRGERT